MYVILRRSGCRRKGSVCSSAEGGPSAAIAVRRRDNDLRPPVTLDEHDAVIHAVVRGAELRGGPVRSGLMQESAN